MISNSYIYPFKPLPDNAPAVFDKLLADYRNGTIDGIELQRRIVDAIASDPTLKGFKDEHLRWTDHAHEDDISEL